MRASWPALGLEIDWCRGTRRSPNNPALAEPKIGRTRLSTIMVTLQRAHPHTPHKQEAGHAERGSAAAAAAAAAFRSLGAEKRGEGGSCRRLRVAIATTTAEAMADAGGGQLSPTAEQLHAVLKKYWGHNAFR